jgi:hypothetical protein
MWQFDLIIEHPERIAATATLVRDRHLPGSAGCCLVPENTTARQRAAALGLCMS